MKVIFFCASCGIMLGSRPCNQDEGDACENCNGDLSGDGSIPGQFYDADAQRLLTTMESSCARP